MNETTRSEIPMTAQFPQTSEGSGSLGLASKMQLHKRFEEEYKKRHDVLWTDLEAFLISTGISDYSIFLDEPKNALFGVMKANNRAALNDLPANPVMKKWWDYMENIMKSNEDNSPVSIPLKEVFYLP